MVALKNTCEYRFKEIQILSVIQLVLTDHFLKQETSCCNQAEDSEGQMRENKQITHTASV